MKGQIVNIVFGIWIMASPAVLHFDGSTMGHINHIIGPLVITFAIIALSEATREVRKANVLMGVLLMATPWMLTSSDFFIIINNTISGLVVLFASFDKGKVHNSFAGGWSALWSEEIPPEQQE